MQSFFERPPIAREAMSLVIVVHGPPRDAWQVAQPWREAACEFEQSVDVVVVDNTGGPSDALLKQAESDPHLEIVTMDSPAGIGACLRAGIAAAPKHPLLAYCNNAAAYAPADWKKLHEQIDKVDVVCGYRQWRPPPWWFRAVEWPWRGFLRVFFGLETSPRPCWLDRKGLKRRLAAYWIFGLPVYDAECGLRLLRRELFERIPIQSKGIFADVEILAKANFLGALLTEEAVEYRPERDPRTVTARDRTDFRRVLHDPDFGPVEIETQGYTCLSDPMLPCRAECPPEPNGSSPAEATPDAAPTACDEPAGDADPSADVEQS